MIECKHIFDVARGPSLTAQTSVQAFIRVNSHICIVNKSKDLFLRSQKRTLYCRLVSYGHKSWTSVVLDVVNNIRLFYYLNGR